MVAPKDKMWVARSAAGLVVTRVAKRVDKMGLTMAVTMAAAMVFR